MKELYSLIPVVWDNHPAFRFKDGTRNFLAMRIMADLIAWYTPNKQGKFRFSGDTLQWGYPDYRDQGFSEYQFRSAVRVLEQAGLIYTELRSGKFGGGWCSNARFMAPMLDQLPALNCNVGWQLLAHQLKDDGKAYYTTILKPTKGSSCSVLKDHPKVCLTTYTNTLSNTLSTTQSGAATASRIFTTGSSEKTVWKKEEKEKEESVDSKETTHTVVEEVFGGLTNYHDMVEDTEVNADEILKLRDAKKAMGASKTSPEGLWKAGVSRSTFKYVRPLGAKERAILKQLYGLWGESFPELLAWVFENWGVFAKKALTVEGKGWADFPPEPSLEFLRKYQHVAQVMAQEQKERDAALKQKQAAMEKQELREAVTQPLMQPDRESAQPPKEDPEVLELKKLWEAKHGKNFDEFFASIGKHQS